MHIVPTNACGYIDPQLIFDKLTQVQKVDGQEKRVFANLGNQNIQKVSVSLAKMAQSLLKEEEFETELPNELPESEITTKNKAQMLDILHQIVIKKIEILRKNKGKLRVQLDELNALDTIISDVLSHGSECNPEYLQLYKLFLKHIHDHYQGYLPNEDVPGLLKYIYSSDSKYFLQAKKESPKEMQLLNTNLLPKHMGILNSCFKPKLDFEAITVVEPVQSEESADQENPQDVAKKIEAANNQFDEHELFVMLDSVLDNLPVADYHRNLIIDQVEASI